MRCIDDRTRYIDATNLAKIRAAKMILRDVLPMGPAQEHLMACAFSVLDDYERRLTRSVKTTEAPTKVTTKGTA